jgi:hypothetical protein
MNKKNINLFGDHLWKKYRCRVLKLSINAGFSCPNRDGTFGKDGCIFCSDEGSASPTSMGHKGIHDQMRSAEISFKRADEQTKFIAYLQAYSGTYAPPARLKSVYDEAVSYPNTVGLMIATRPDCVSDNVLDLIASYKQENFELWLELGMQSIHDKSLDFLNRCHNHQKSRTAVAEASGRSIPVCAHIILGIPGESWHDMMETADEISSLPINGVKFHHMHVIKNTMLEKIYFDKNLRLISMKEYTSVICDFLERLRPDILIHRLSGDRDSDTLIAPSWGRHKGSVIQSIQDELKNRGTYQGFLCD